MTVMYSACSMNRMPGGLKYAFCAALLLCSTAGATNVYVVPPDTPGAAPDGLFTTWSTAATNIQDAINAINTNGGNIVYISNGVYHLTNEIAVNKGIVLRSWSNGLTAPASTILDADNYPGKPETNRVLYVNHVDAIVDGLKLQGGNGRGGGILIGRSAMITNCIIYSNVTANYGAGIATEVVGRKVGLITHCNVIYNEATNGGGGFFLNDYSTGIIEHCSIEWNKSRANNAANGGGGFYGTRLGTNLIVRWCTIAHNTASYRDSGGGVNIWYSGIIENCVIVSNHQISTSTGRSGHDVYIYYGTNVYLRNCLVAGNTNTSRDVVHCQFAGNIENCTIANNAAGGIGNYTNDAGARVVNTIMYDNLIDAYTNNIVFSNCVASVVLPGADNITNAPIFADAGFRLAADSPGINAGLNLPWMSEPGAIDLDGRRRVDAIQRRVDMGCYEYLYRGSLFNIK